MEHIDYFKCSQAFRTSVLESVMTLDHNEFSLPWKMEDWYKLECLERYRLFVGIDNKKPISFALFDCLAGDEVGHLLKILVTAQCRRTGAGQKLFEFSLANLASTGVKSVYLEVSTKNTQAISFYLKNDFKQIHLIKSYYSDGSDASAMQLLI